MPTPAPIAAWLDALVAQLNTVDAQAVLGVAARRTYQETIEAKNHATHLVLLPYQWRPLGRCGALRLEQHLVNVIIHRRDAQADVTRLDADQLLAVNVRALLEDFAAGSGRVVEIIGPLTIDQEKLQTPGVSQIQLLLDCDLLLTSEADAPTVSTSIMTTARNAFWSSINNWPALADVFARKYQTDAQVAELQLRDPVAAELPAIAIYWDSVKPTWKTNRMQEWPLALRMTLWLPGDQHTAAEQLAQDCFEAIYQATPDGSQQTYIRAATGYPVRRVSDMTVRSVTLGRTQQLKAMRVDVAFTLSSNKDPFGDDA